MYTIYSKYGCPFCSKVRDILELSEQKFVKYELGIDYTREEFYLKFGNGSTFPQVVLNDGTDTSVKLGGCTDTIAYLKEQKII